MKRVRIRSMSRMVVFVAFFLVPFFNIFRIDVPRMRFYVFGKKFAYDDGYILLLSILFLVFLVVVSAKLSHRFFCSYMCPHNTLTGYLIRLGQKYKGLDWLLAVILAPVAAFSLLSYFIDPQSLLQSVLSLKLASMFGFYIFFVAILFLLFGVLRYKFCTNACPYGFFQMVFKDAPQTGQRKWRIGTVVPLLLLLVNGVSLLYFVVSHPGYHVRINRMTGNQLPNAYLFVGNIEIENLEYASQEYKLNLQRTSPDMQVKMQQQVTVEAESIYKIPVIITGKRLNDLPLQVRVENRKGHIIVKSISG